MARTLPELVHPYPKTGENPIVAGSGVRVARALRDRNCAIGYASKMMQEAVRRHTMRGTIAAHRVASLRMTGTIIYSGSCLKALE
jgi:hypothetical protein